MRKWLSFLKEVIKKTRGFKNKKISLQKESLEQSDFPPIITKTKKTKKNKEKNFKADFVGQVIAISRWCAFLLPIKFCERKNSENLIKWSKFGNTPALKQIN